MGDRKRNIIWWKRNQELEKVTKESVKKKNMKTEIETEICRGGNGRPANKDGMTEGKRAH